MVCVFGSAGSPAQDACNVEYVCGKAGRRKASGTPRRGPRPDLRSEEHTSEPSHQIISYAVFCLKKKNTNQVVSVGADIAFDADPKFFACLVRFESSSVPTTLPTAYDVSPFDVRHDCGY